MSIDRMKKFISGSQVDRVPICGGIDNFEFARSCLGYDILEDQSRSYTDLISMFDYDFVTGWANPYGEYNVPMVRYFDEVEWDPAIELKTSVLEEALRWRTVHHRLKPRVVAQPLGFTPTLFTRDYGISDVDEALDFDPLAADPRSMEEVADFLRDYYSEGNRRMPKAAFVPWYYNLLFMWPVEIFGWELFLTAAMADEERFDELLGRFAELSYRDLAAIAEVSDVGLAILHDDLCSSTGPIFNPDWYRKHIFPRYEEIIEPLKKRGNKIIYCIDGTVDVLLDDILRCGFDGLQLQPETDLKLACEKLLGHGKTFIGTNFPQLELERSRPEEIPEKLNEFIGSFPDGINLFLAAGGFFNNVPAENIAAYFECLGRGHCGSYARRA